MQIHLERLHALFFYSRRLEPSAKVWLRSGILIITGLVLIITQSKTSILAVLVGLLTIAIGRILTKNRDQSRYSSEIVIDLIIVSSTLLVVSTVWVTLYDWGIGVVLNRNLRKR